MEVTGGFRDEMLEMPLQLTNATKSGMVAVQGQSPVRDWMRVIT